MPQPDTLDPRIVGRRITEARKSRGKTQEEVAHYLRCDIVEALRDCGDDPDQPGVGAHGRGQRVAAGLRQIAAQCDPLIRRRSTYLQPMKMREMRVKSTKMQDTIGKSWRLVLVTRASFVPG